jgi:hypothetical protein
MHSWVWTFSWNIFSFTNEMNENKVKMGLKIPWGTIMFPKEQDLSCPKEQPCSWGKKNSFSLKTWLFFEKKRFKLFVETI